MKDIPSPASPRVERRDERDLCHSWRRVFYWIRLIVHRLRNRVFPWNATALSVAWEGRRGDSLRFDGHRRSVWRGDYRKRSGLASTPLYRADRVGNRSHDVSLETLPPSLLI